MAKSACTDAEFITLYQELGPHKLSRRLKVNLRAIYTRRARIEGRAATTISSPQSLQSNLLRQSFNPPPGRLLDEIKDGIILIGSDSHYWPGEPSIAHRAFVQFCKEYKPDIIVKNGDVLDGSSISRHPPIGWEHSPTVQEEIEVCQERLSEIENSSKNSRLYWPLGNHDARFETRLATIAPEFAKVHGVHLKDHFPRWRACWSVWVNDDVVIKHRFRGGVHAARTNTLQSGKTTITGHLHSLKVSPFTDYHGTRWGVDCGTLADPLGPQFMDYTEDNPKDWRPGFIMLSFVNGRLLWPEIISVHDDNHVDFRGKLEYIS